MNSTDVKSSITVLKINSSSRIKDSVTRQLSCRVISKLEEKKKFNLLTRDLSQGVEFINEHWVKATFTAVSERTESQHQALSYSDILVDEVMQADMIVIGAPVYNFGIPAVLKAWFDQIARSGVTFKYTDNGPVGLLKNKQVVIAVASGGVPLGSAVDFVSPYLKQIFNFIGISDIKFVTAMQLNSDAETAMVNVDDQINNLNFNIFNQSLELETH